VVSVQYLQVIRVAGFKILAGNLKRSASWSVMDGLASVHQVPQEMDSRQ
jgi:hypothetical protein